MSANHQQILIAAYSDLSQAHQDFGDLESRLKHGMELRSAALVTKGPDGEAQVEEAANKHGRAGTMIGMGIGALLGLVFQPLLLGVLVGGAGGALATAVAEHELRSGLKHEVGAALQKGTAVVVALVYPEGRSSVEATLGRAHSITALEMDKATINSIDEAVAAEIARLTSDPLTSDTGDTNT